MATCHIGLGSNLGNRRANLVASLELIGRIPGTAVRRVSTFFETAPVGGPTDQQPFLNGAAELETVLTPRVLLERLREIELQLGRARSERWGPRPIDLDILLWGQDRTDAPDLTVPHPRMHFRRFVLEPLVEIAPQVRHPAGWTMAERWQQINRSPHYLAITGPMGVGKTTVARQLAQSLGATLVEEQFDAERLGRLYAGDRAEGPAVQDDFLASRRELLHRTRWADGPPQWVVSDFWFAQSLAYNELMLDGGVRDEHRTAVERASADVLEPTLVIWLDASVDDLLGRVAGRGRQCESPVERRFLAALRDGYARLLTEPEGPPLYRAEATTIKELVRELLVVAHAIRG